MRIFFAGGEVAAHRKTLENSGVERVAVNYALLRRRISKKNVWDLDDHFGENTEITMYCRITSDDVDEQKEVIESYVEFVTAQISRIHLIVEADVDWSWAERDRLYGHIPPGMFVPVWHPGEDINEVCAQNQWIAVQNDLEPREILQLSTAARRYKTQILGLNARREALTGHNRIYDAVITSHWLSTSRYGELIVWDGTQIRRYAKSERDRAKNLHRAHIAKSNVPIEDVLSGGKQALTKLALWSWLELEKSMVKRSLPKVGLNELLEEQVSNYLETSGEEDNLEIHEGGVDNLPEKTGNDYQLIPDIIKREQVALPNLFVSTKTSQGDDGIERTEQVVDIRNESLRQCNTCVLSATCPAFKPDHGCAYNFPVELDTKEQLIDMLHALLKIQGDRILFSRMAEELQGGYPDPTLSGEMDRFFEMVEKLKEISDTRDFVKLTAEVKANHGTLSRLFGPGAAQVAQALPGGHMNRFQTDALAANFSGQKTSEIVEAEVIE